MQSDTHNYYSIFLPTYCTILYNSILPTKSVFRVASFFVTWPEKVNSIARMVTPYLPSCNSSHLIQEGMLCSTDLPEHVRPNPVMPDTELLRSWVCATHILMLSSYRNVISMPILHDLLAAAYCWSFCAPESSQQSADGLQDHRTHTHAHIHACFGEPPTDMQTMQTPHRSWRSF